MGFDCLVLKMDSLWACQIAATVIPKIMLHVRCCRVLERRLNLNHERKGPFKSKGVLNLKANLFHMALANKQSLKTMFVQLLFYQQMQYKCLECLLKYSFTNEVFGSAIMISSNIPKQVVTPPVMGDVM